ncbi:MAG TPA: guanylate kinase [Pirellulales bacterium]|nr:guanylate kinase [Pirellulales bacterium]
MDSPSSTRPAAGQVIVISGPSGAGKTTLLRKLLADCPLPLQRSVSATTRSPRPGEQPDVDYHFLSRDEFQRRRQAGDFLECCEVFGRGDWYGTLVSEVAPRLVRGKWVILEVDVQGAMAVLEQYPDALTIFVLPGNIEQLQRRLAGRGTESDESMARRLDAAARELSMADRYRHRVVNENLDQAVGDICAILKQELNKSNE